MKILLLVAGMAVLSGKILAADVVEMSASDVIKKSEAAYAAVKTYVGTTTVRGKTDFGAMKLEQVSTAKVTFMRPGKLRIEGRTTSRDPSGKDGHPFAIVSDGFMTWKSWAIQNNGAFSAAPSLSTAMAGVTGIANGAANGIPAALMKGNDPWAAGQDPFMIPRLSPTKLEGHEKIEDADCYKLVAKHPQLGDVTLWIDSNSFLLRQMTKETSEAQLAAAKKSAEEAMKKIGKVMPAPSAGAPVVKSKSDFFTFTIDQVDGAVDANLFNDPTKK